MRTSTVLRIILAIQHLVVRGFYFEDLGLVVEVAPRMRSIRCGECGGKARRVKDRRVRRWRHLDLAGMMVHLLYKIRRVHCDACGSVKTEQVSWAGPGSNFTYAFGRAHGLSRAAEQQHSGLQAPARDLADRWPGHPPRL